MDDKDKNPAGGTPNAGANGANGGNANPNADDKNKGQEGGEKTTFTKDEVQAELDRVAAKTRDEERKRTEKLVADEVKKATEEAQRTAKLSEEERQKEIFAKEKADLEEQKRQVTIRENLADVKVILGDLKYPTELAELLVDLDKDVQANKIAVLKAGIGAIVKNAIADATKGKPQQDPTNNSTQAGADGKPKTQF